MPYTNPYSTTSSSKTFRIPYASPTSDYAQETIVKRNYTVQTMDQALAEYKKQQDYVNEQKKKKKKKTKTKVNTDSSSGPDKGQANPAQPDGDYRWNLPPHRWSLPVKPQYVNDVVNPLGDIEKYRRGRMFWYASNVQDFVQGDGKNKKSVLDRKYGFQFLWNPDTYSTAIQLNTETTPSPSDRFVGVAGAFPSGESISFTLRLDRTNDFACMRSLLARDYTANTNLINNSAATQRTSRIDTTSLGGILAASQVDPALIKSSSPTSFLSMTDYYTLTFGSGVLGKDEIAKQIKDLMELGTVADIEYLYKAINGGGWKNVLGRETSDIGFLSATLLRIDMGPLSYIGYVNSLNISHLAFSEDMTPIRSDVQISMNLMASAGIASKEGTPGAVSPTQ